MVPLQPLFKLLLFLLVARLVAVGLFDDDSLFRRYEGKMLLLCSKIQYALLVELALNGPLTTASTKWKQKDERFTK